MTDESNSTSENPDEPDGDPPEPETTEPFEKNFATQEALLDLFAPEHTMRHKERMEDRAEFDAEAHRGFAEEQEARAKKAKQDKQEKADETWADPDPTKTPAKMIVRMHDGTSVKVSRKTGEAEDEDDELIIEELPPPRAGPPTKLVLIGIALGFVLLGAAFGYSSLGDSDSSTQVPDPASESQEQSDTPADLTPEQLDDLTDEQIDEFAASPGFADCPPGFQLDVIGRIVSRQADPVPEQPTETAAQKAGNPICTKAETTNSYLFTMIVEGDGEWLSAQEYTSYQVRFYVNNEWPGNSFHDDTGFEVFIWFRGETGYTAEVKDSSWTAIADAEVEVDWLDSSTLQAHVTLPSPDVELIEMRTELYIYATEEDGSFLYDNLDVAIWTADQ